MEKGIFYVIMEEKAQREDVMVQKSLGKLVQYGLAAGLIQKEDKIYIMNTLLELLGIEGADSELEQMAVSYTHLDVYKRQQHCGGGAGAGKSGGGEELSGLQELQN